MKARDFREVRRRAWWRCRAGLAGEGNGDMRIAIIILVCLLFSGAGVPLASDGDD